ncbi:Malto-oligosyltrehalose trehalohydrolase [Komagataeibacter xylinus E25]|nr:Malto-oligosyltrehalose trehalohydrolase [Komagataeibacter xylinus E25]
MLAEGFAFQGEISPVTDRPRGSPSGDLPSERFIIFLQNHDQIGNRALGERLNILAPEPALRAAYGLVLLCPQIPMLFMGEEWGSRQPFLFFTSHTPGLGRIVRDGRRREFAAFSHFASEKTRNTIPDPNAPETFTASCLHDAERTAPDHVAWTAFIHHLLALRHRWIMPRLSGAHAMGARAIGPKAVVARWRMADGAVLGIALNLGDAPVDLPDPLPGQCLYISPMPETGGISGVLPACSVMVCLAEVPDE